MSIQKMIEKKRRHLTYNTTPRPLFVVDRAEERDAKKIPSVRIELTTLGLLDPRSNQLSYEGVFCGCGYHATKSLHLSFRSVLTQLLRSSLHAHGTAAANAHT